MNKKVSTLLTLGLVLGGSLLSSSAFAQTRELAADTKLDGSAFYYLGDGINWLKGEEVKEGNVVKFTKLSAEGTATAALTDANLWSVSASNHNGTYYYTLTNKATGKVLYFQASGDVLDDAANAKINNLFWANLTEGKYVANGGNITVTTSKEIKIASTSVTVESTGTPIKIYTVDDKVTSGNPFEDAQGAFALEYKIGKDIATENIFAQDLRAIEVSAGDKYVAGIYFVVNAPADLKDSYKASTPADVRDLNKLTFVAVDPSKDWNINELKTKGEGMKFTTVRGSSLVKAVDAEAGDVATNNAAFSVYTNANNEGDFKLKVTPYVDVIKNEGKDNEETVSEVANEMTIAAVEDQQGIYVTTVEAPTNVMDSWASLTQANIIEVADFLTKDDAMVYNIQFTSKVNGNQDKTKSEYGKYLGLGNNTNKDLLVAQGLDYIIPNAPQNQWVITDADKNDNSFTFTNREDDAQSFTVQLVKTSKENEYRLIDKGNTKFVYAYEGTDGVKTYSNTTASEDCDLANTVVKLIPATVNPMAGYVSNELDNTGLVKLSFTVESAINPIQLFVTGEALKKALNKDIDKATAFELVKFTEEGDTLVQYQDYAYWDAKKEEVKYKEEGDTVSVVTYAFKAVGKDADGKIYKNQYLKNDLTVDGSESDAEDAQRFAIKLNADGSYALIPCTSSVKDIKTLNEENTFMVTGVGSDITGAISTNEKVYADHKAFFSIEGETLGNSWNHVPQHVTMQDAKVGGFVAVGESEEGILAPTTTPKDELKFWLDTTNTEAHVPAFYISKGGKYMYNAIDSAYYFNNGVATDKLNPDFILPGTIDGDDFVPRAVFQSATLKDANTLVIKQNGKDVELTSENGLDNYKFNIVENEDGDYYVRSLRGSYLYNLNGELGFSSEKTAMSVVLERVEAPTSNEGVATSEVKVVANNGSINVKNAAGKNVVVSTILGQVVANEVLTSDNATINVPAGIVVVAVEGESFKVNVK